MYCKVASSNTSRLEAHPGFFRLLMKGIFDPYVRSNLQLYDKKTQVCPLLAIWDIQLATNTNAIHKEFCPIVRHVELLLGSPD